MRKQTTAAQKPSFDWPVHLIIISLLILGTLVAYWQVSSHDFVLYDDPDYVRDNPHIKMGIDAQSVHWAFSLTSYKQYAANWHPLTWITHMVDYNLYKMNPGPHHVGNVILHILSAILLFYALSRMTGSVWRAGFVAALFAIHPVHVESVAWLAERKDCLSTFFWMFTLVCYYYYARRPGVLSYLAVIGAFALGLLSKPMLVSLPITLLLLDYWPLNRLGSKDKTSRTLGWLIIEKTPMFVMSLASCIVTYIAQNGAGAVDAWTNLSLGVRVADAFAAYAAYIFKMLWPFNLAVFYPHPGPTLPTYIPIGSLLLLLAITAAVMFYGRQKRYLQVGWVWFLVTLVPVIGLIQVGEQSMADRYTYVPLIGLFVIIAWLIPDLFIRRTEPVKAKTAQRTATPRQEATPISPQAYLLGGIAGIVLVVLLVLCYMQVAYWQNSITLFQHAIAVNPNNYLAYNNLGGYLDQQSDKAITMQERVSLMNEAEQSIRHCLQIKPDYARGHNMLGNVLCKMGKLDEARIHYEQALGAMQNDAIALSNMGIVYGKSGKLDESIKYLKQSISVNPEFKNAYNNLGLAYGLQGKYDESVAAYEHAIALDPNYETAHMNLGTELIQLKRIPEAIEHLQAATQINPRYGEAHGHLAEGLASAGRFEEALQEAKLATQLGYPISPAALSRLQSRASGPR